MPLLRPGSSKRFAAPQPWVQVMLVFSILLLIAIVIGAYRIRTNSVGGQASLVETLPTEEVANEQGQKRDTEDKEPTEVTSVVVDVEPENKATRSSGLGSRVTEQNVVENDAIEIPVLDSSSFEPDETTTSSEQPKEAEVEVDNEDSNSSEPSVPDETTAPAPAPTPKEQPVEPTPVKEEVKEATVRIAISGPGGGSYVVTTTEGSTVESVMRSASGLTFTTKPFAGMGSFVESINGVANNTSTGLYWTFYLNGSFASRGISSQTVRDGDQIEWRYQASPL